jgi:hypothetical protein
MQKAIGNNTLANRVLRCVTSKQQTSEEIRKRYLQLYPPSRIMSKLIRPISIIGIESGLELLVREGYVQKEITRFTDEALSEDTSIFKTTQKGFETNLKR